MRVSPLRRSASYSVQLPYLLIIIMRENGGVDRESKRRESEKTKSVICGHALLF